MISTAAVRLRAPKEHALGSSALQCGSGLTPIPLIPGADARFIRVAIEIADADDIATAKPERLCGWTTLGDFFVRYW